MTPVLLSILFGLAAGRIVSGWIAGMVNDLSPSADLLIHCPACGKRRSRRSRWIQLAVGACSCGNSTDPVRWPWAVMATAAGLCGLFAWLSLPPIRCMAVHEVRPEPFHWWLRLGMYEVLIVLLTAATVTDLMDYVIPDEIVLTGLGIAVPLAFISGQLQLIHLWVNWDEAYVSLYGPYIPDWIKQHQHLHGLAWSVAGAVCGFSVTWLVRAVSGALLGRPALGLGDATLMAMAGAFIGWQPVLCAIALSPVPAVVCGGLVRIVTGRSFVAYGPWLAVSVYLVAASWRWLWADRLTLRDIFSHWPTVAGLVGGSIGGIAVLLIAIRVYRNIPVRRR